MPDVLVPLLASMGTKPEGQRPALYACENDHDATDKVEESLRGGLAGRSLADAGRVPVWLHR